MSKSFGVSTGPGATAIVTGDQGVISFQRYDANGLVAGGPTVIAESHGLDGKFFGVGVDVDSFAVVSLTTGGFEVVFDEASGDPQGFTRQLLVGVEVDAAGNLITSPSVNADNGLTAGNFHVALDSPIGKISGAMPADPQLYELAGGRYAVAYETFDSHNVATSHVAFGAAAGLYSDTVVASRPDEVGGGLGDVTLIWFQTTTGSGGIPTVPGFAADPLGEVLADDGSVLTPQGVFHTYTLSTTGFTAVSSFDPAHNQIAVQGPNGAYAFGPTTTLTFDVRDHSLTWEQDSEGPSAPVLLTTLNTDTFGVANLQAAFRPEVLKVIAADGSSTIQWFDSDNSQPWETLIATETAGGAAKTYASMLDDGTKTAFTFDVDNSQPYTRYVDQDDAAGYILSRTVLVDTGNSWMATYTYAGGQVVSYEVDSFDSAGVLVAKNFFNPDGSILAH
jgi:hypothetical protein